MPLIDLEGKDTLTISAFELTSIHLNKERYTVENQVTALEYAVLPKDPKYSPWIEFDEVSHNLTILAVTKEPVLLQLKYFASSYLTVFVYKQFIFGYYFSEKS